MASAHLGGKGCQVGLVVTGGGKLCYATSPTDARCLAAPPPDPVYVRAAGSAPILRVNESFYEVSNPAIRAYQSSVAHCFPERAMPEVVGVAPASGFVATMF